MTVRIALVAAATLVLSASSAKAQARTPQRVVLSQAVMKAMVANKPKKKTPLTARVGMVRRAGVVSTKPIPAAPTSVSQIWPSTKKK